MSFKAIFHHTAAKKIKNTKNKSLKTKVKQEIDLIIANPSQGKLLEHPFRKYKIQSHRFSYQTKNFRIAYTVNKKQQEIAFLAIDTRENFYKNLKKLL